MREVLSYGVDFVADVAAWPPNFCKPVAFEHGSACQVMNRVSFNGVGRAHQGLIDPANGGRDIRIPLGKNSIIPDQLPQTIAPRLSGPPHTGFVKIKSETVHPIDSGATRGQVGRDLSRQGQNDGDLSAAVWVVDPSNLAFEPFRDPLDNG